MFGNGNPLLHLLDKLSQNRLVGKFVTLASVLFFLVFVLGPLFFVFFKLSSFKYLPEMENALIVSFSLAFYVTLADLVFGIPVAWLLAKKNFPFKELFDTLIDLPLVIPTSALGLSVALMWGSSGLGVFNPGFEVLFLLHVAFTFPYVVRTAQASIMTIDTDLGRAAQSLGASPFTIFRNVWMPLSKPGIISGSILAFTRSLGETGASILVAGAIKTVPVLTVFYKNSTPADIDAAISISAILIAVSAFIFLFARSSIDSKKSGLGKIFVDAERRISGYSGAGMVAGVLFFAAIVLLPSFFFLKYTDANFLSKDILEAITISFAIGLSATILSIALGLPFAMYLASKGLGSRLFKLVNEMCMLMPTVTIGISLSLFWAGRLDERILLVFTSIAVIFPYFVSSVCEILESTDRSLIEVARSLGAKPFGAFRTVTLPLIMPTFIAGTVIAFMRSVAETGSTLAVSKTIVTIPLLIVNLSKAGKNSQAASAAVLLLLISLVVVFVLRSVQKRKW